MSLALLYVPVPNAEVAKSLAELLLKSKLAACINVLGPIKSYYVWNSEIESSDEFILIVKTLSDIKEDAAEMLRVSHPYETPCILSLDNVTANEKFVEYIRSAISNLGA